MNRHVEPPARTMTFDEFVAFVDTRPDEEKWELLEGHVVMSPTPIAPHQNIVKNLTLFFGLLERRKPQPWMVLPGLSVHVAEVPASVPQPDVLIVGDVANQGWFTSGPLVVFEILLPSTRKRDLTIKREIYGRMPTIVDYVIIAPKKVEVSHCTKAGGWQPRTVRDRGASLALEGIGIELPLAEIYFDLAV
jgi:Uma2 family endonuclease